MPVRRFWIVVPAQAFGRGKTRLASVLDTEGRRRFSRGSFRRVVTMARKVAGAHCTLVVSGSGEVLDLGRRLGVMALAENRSGLNAAVAHAAMLARRRGASAMIVFHADLPLLRQADLRYMFRALSKHPGVILAPDDAHEGTNGLGIRPISPFRFWFGPESFKKHRAEARRRRLRARVIERHGIAFDVDTPDQYHALLQMNRLGLQQTLNRTGPAPSNS